MPPKKVLTEEEKRQRAAIQEVASRAAAEKVAARKQAEEEENARQEAAAKEMAALREAARKKMELEEKQKEAQAMQRAEEERKKQEAAEAERIRKAKEEQIIREAHREAAEEKRRKAQREAELRAEQTAKRIAEAMEKQKEADKKALAQGVPKSNRVFLDAMAKTRTDPSNEALHVVSTTPLKSVCATRVNTRKGEFTVLGMEKRLAQNITRQSALEDLVHYLFIVLSKDHDVRHPKAIQKLISDGEFEVDAVKLIPILCEILDKQPGNALALIALKIFQSYGNKALQAQCMQSRLLPVTTNDFIGNVIGRKLFFQYSLWLQQGQNASSPFQWEADFGNAEVSSDSATRAEFNVTRQSSIKTFAEKWVRKLTNSFQGTVPGLTSGSVRIIMKHFRGAFDDYITSHQNVISKITQIDTTTRKKFETLEEASVESGTRSQRKAILIAKEERDAAIITNIQAQQALSDPTKATNAMTRLAEIQREKQSLNEALQAQLKDVEAQSHPVPDHQTTQPTQTTAMDVEEIAGFDAVEEASDEEEGTDIASDSDGSQSSTFDDNDSDVDDDDDDSEAEF